MSTTRPILILCKSIIALGLILTQDRGINGLVTARPLYQLNDTFNQRESQNNTTIGQTIICNPRQEICNILNKIVNMNQVPLEDPMDSVEMKEFIDTMDMEANNFINPTENLVNNSMETKIFKNSFNMAEYGTESSTVHPIRQSPSETNNLESFVTAKDAKKFYLETDQVNETEKESSGQQDIINYNYQSRTTIAPIFHWCLLELTGNETIIRKRYDDFVNYLRINMASLTKSDYENIIFNGVTFSPEILVNMSLDWRFAQSTLDIMMELVLINQTILNLSGQHFTLRSFKDSDAILAPKPILTKLNSREIEVLIYMAVGTAIAFILFCIFGFILYHSLRDKNTEKYKDKVLEASKIFTKSTTNSNIMTKKRSMTPSFLIYPQEFIDDINSSVRAQQYTPLDENLFPINLDYDFIPHYLQEDSQGIYLPLSSSIQSNSGYLSTFTDDNESNSPQQPVTNDQSDERTSLLDHQSITPSPSPEEDNKMSNSLLLKKRPPHPPGRYNSLQPRVRTRSHLKSSTATLSYLSSPGFKLSVPTPYHTSSFNNSTLSLTCPPRPCSVPADFDRQHLKPSEDKINKDVEQVFHELGLNDKINN